MAALSIVKNITRRPLGLPLPFSGTLVPGGSATVPGAPEAVISLLGGRLSAGVFSVNPAPDGSVASTLSNDPNVTFSAFTVTIDQVKGVDPTSGGILRQQADVPATPFKSIGAVIKALPSFIRHPVTLAFVDGTYTLDAVLPFGDQTGLRFGLPDDYNFFWTGDLSPGGQIVYTSLNGSIRAPSTPLMTAAVNADPTIFQANASSGLSSDAYRRYFIRIVSGTGAGQVKAIRTHTATNFTVAGRFSPAPDTTSKAEIIQASAKLQIGSSFQNMLSGPQPFDGNYVTNAFSHIDVLGGSGYFFEATNWSFQMASARFLALGLSLTNCVMSTPRGIFDAQNIGAFAGFTMALVGGMMRSVGSDDSTIIGGDTRSGSVGLFLQASINGNPGAGLFQLAIDDVGVGIQVYGKGAHFDWIGNRLTGRNVTVAGVQLFRGGWVTVSATDIVATGALGLGAPTQFILDGVNKTAANIGAATNNQLVGVVGSVLEYSLFPFSP